jgi:hypothetical protein
LNAGRASSPAYDAQVVARAILEEVLLRRPDRLTVAELRQKVVGDPDDEREVETALEAIHYLRESGLIRYRDDDQLVEPTQAVLRYVALVELP